MFEDSLVESQKGLASKNRRWITAASIALQSLIAAAIIAIPLVKPEALALHTNPPVLVVPPLLKRPAVIKTVQPPARTSNVISLPTFQAPTQAAKISPSQASNPQLACGDPAPMSLSRMGDPGPGTGTGLFGPSLPGGPAIKVAPPKVPVRISAGISAGMLLSEIRPLYPPMAKAAQVSGTVIIEATISKTGMIESAHIVSGPAMLQSAAIEAVRSARYKPYRLNGDPAEVQTTVTVVFRLGS